MKRVLAVLCFCLVAAFCQEARTAVSNPIGPSPLPVPGTPPKRFLGALLLGMPSWAYAV